MSSVAANAAGVCAVTVCWHRMCNFVCVLGLLPWLFVLCGLLSTDVQHTVAGVLDCAGAAAQLDRVLAGIVGLAEAMQHSHCLLQLSGSTHGLAPLAPNFFVAGRYYLPWVLLYQPLPAFPAHKPHIWVRVWSRTHSLPGPLANMMHGAMSAGVVKSASRGEYCRCILSVSGVNHALRLLVILGQLSRPRGTETYGALGEFMICMFVDTFELCEIRCGSLCKAGTRAAAKCPHSLFACQCMATTGS